MECRSSFAKAQVELKAKLCRKDDLFNFSRRVDVYGDKVGQRSSRIYGRDGVTTEDLHQLIALMDAVS